MRTLYGDATAADGSLLLTKAEVGSEGSALLHLADENVAILQFRLRLTLIDDGADQRVYSPDADPGRRFELFFGDADGGRGPSGAELTGLHVEFSRAGGLVVSYAGERVANASVGAAMRDGAVAVELQVLETDLYDSANVDMPKPGRRLQTAPRATRNLIVRYGGATALSNVTLARWAPQPH